MQPAMQLSVLLQKLVFNANVADGQQHDSIDGAYV